VIVGRTTQASWTDVHDESRVAVDGPLAGTDARMATARPAVDRAVKEVDS
jgi:hypothetical protein